MEENPTIQIPKKLSGLSESDQETMDKGHLKHWWRNLIFFIPFFGQFYAAYRGWRGINIENKILKIKKQKVRSKSLQYGAKLNTTDCYIRDKGKIGMLYKILTIIFPPYTIFRAIRSIRLENELIDLKKDEVFETQHIPNLPPEIYNPGNNNTSVNFKEHDEVENKNNNTPEKNLDNSRDSLRNNVIE